MALVRSMDMRMAYTHSLSQVLISSKPERLRELMLLAIAAPQQMTLPKLEKEDCM